MKTLIVLSVLFATAHADEFQGADLAATCSTVESNTSLDNLSGDVRQVECNEINRANSCAEVKTIDRDRRAQLLASMTALDEAYKSSNGNLQIKKSSSNLTSDISEQLGADAVLATRLTSQYSSSSRELKLNEYYRLSNQTPVSINSQYHTFLKRSGNEAKFAELKENFVDDYMEFDAEFECQRGVQVQTSSTILTVGNDVEKSAGMQKCETREDEYRRKMRAKLDDFKGFFNDKYTGEKGLQYGLSCSDDIQIRKFTTVAYEQRSCAGRFEQLFKDNEWDMDLSSLSDDEKYQEFKACIEKMQAEGFKLTNVSISASASQLNNSGEAARQFCKKGFRELSQARANSAKNLLASEFSIPGDKMNTYTNGENGNGSSGACPYKMVNGQEVLKPEFANGKPARKELDDAKYVKVSANFEPKQMPAQREKSCYTAYISCSKVTYKCGEWSRYDSGWSSRQAGKRRQAAAAR